MGGWGGGGGGQWSLLWHNDNGAQPGSRTGTVEAELSMKSVPPINTKAQIVQTELVRRDAGLELSLKMEPLFYHCISQHRTTLFWARLNIVTREVGLALTACWSFLTVHCSVTVTVLGQSFHQPYPLTTNWRMYTLCISPLTIKIAICQHNHWNNELDVGSTKTVRDVHWHCRTAFLTRDEWW